MSAIEEQLREYFDSPPVGVVAGYLFGSTARGADTERSDVDLGFLYKLAPDPKFETQPFLLEAELSEHLARPVQVVVMNGAPVDLVHRILRDGKLLFDIDSSCRIAFEVQARNTYFDLLPILREYRKPRTAS